MTKWNEIYLETRAFHLQTSYSDHISIVITTQNQTQQTRRRKVPRRFEEKWASNPQCETVIQEAWRVAVRNGSPLSKLFEKIKRFRFSLVDWSHASGASSKTLLQEKQKQLEDLCSLNSVDHLDAIKGLKVDINNLLHQEELFWRQRSRSIWLPAGDKNTKFFHQRASQRRRKNQILGAYDSEGRWGTSEDSIAHTAKHYFQQLFISSHPTAIDGVLNSVDRLVTPGMNATLLQRHTPEEVKRTLFQMHSSKSPGPDSMTQFFF